MVVRCVAFSVQPPGMLSVQVVEEVGVVDAWACPLYSRRVVPMQSAMSYPRPACSVLEQIGGVLEKKTHSCQIGFVRFNFR